MTGMEFYFTPKGEVMITDECGTRQLNILARSTGESIIGIYRPTV